MRLKSKRLIVVAHIVLLVTVSTGWAGDGEPASGKAFAPSPDYRHLPSVEEMIDARTDVWGNAAMRQPNGASYGYFVDLLPPLRWVNTEFRHYPIVLSAPRHAQKIRVISNGSAVNARAYKAPMWHELGVPVTFYVGQSTELFGDYLSQLDIPSYLDGYLPVVSFKYQHAGHTYRQEVFAPVDPDLAGRGAAMFRFSIDPEMDDGAPGRGRVVARVDADTPLRAVEGDLIDRQGRSAVAFSAVWRWTADRGELVAQIAPGETAELVVFTKPSRPIGGISSQQFVEHREQNIAAWKKLLEQGTQLETPEPLVNDAWRSMIIGTLMLAVQDRMNYSASNGYGKLYEGECGDTMRSVMLFGGLDRSAAMLKPLLEFNRHDTRFHVAGHKLQLLASYYWLTRDTKTVRAYEPLWRPSLKLILTSREADSGLLPKDRYAGDIKTEVYSLNSNANCWRGVRDVAAMLNDMGATGEAAQLNKQAAEYREAILDAVARSERRDTEPPFIPVALLSDEPAHDPLTATRTGSYYDLICPYVIGSEVFGQGSEREDWLIEYLQQHGGISMGMIRTTPHVGQFNGQPGVNPLYGLRYQLALLRRDDRERALVGFYGQLAQGMTPGTFIGGEGSRFVHGDANGRSFYLPPNSTSNATWLLTLRHLLVQDWDLDEDARPETLRLMFAAPRRWLADGCRVRIADAPTAFGRVSCDVQSRLGAGYVEARVTPPPRPVESLTLRAPLPEGWQVEAVEVDGEKAELIDGDTVDLSGHTKPLTVKFMAKRT